MANDWWGPGQNWLCCKANKHFTAWANSPEGERWRKNRNKSPYRCGYAQPEWMDEARKALGQNDEVAFKAIKLANL